MVHGGWLVWEYLLFFQWLALIRAPKRSVLPVLLRVYIVFSISMHGRAVSGVFSITRIELLLETLSH